MRANYERVICAMRWSTTLSTRFRAFIQPTGGANGCWAWTGRRSGGSPVIDIEQFKVSGARVAWYLVTGELPTGGRFVHRCDNPDCVRPSHLRWEMSRTSHRRRSQGQDDGLIVEVLESLNERPAPGRCAVSLTIKPDLCPDALNGIVAVS